MRAERSTILSVVEQARINNKEISFSGSLAGSAIEWNAVFSGRNCPFTCTGFFKKLSHKASIPPVEMSGKAVPV